jgi:carboxymethylenebutenolidase
MPDPSDLEAVWEAHCRDEFVTFDVDATMATMVPEPYLNHVPTMIGGSGREDVRRFYREHFIGQMPKDTALNLVSRTVGRDRLVDEMVFSFTHDRTVDWMLPGVPATGRRVEVPLVAVIAFADGKVASEHIYWDQASVLVQVGLLDPAGLPVTGAAQAGKLLDPQLPGNALLPRP